MYTVSSERIRKPRVTAARLSVLLPDPLGPGQQHRRRPAHHPRRVQRDAPRAAQQEQQQGVEHLAGQRRALLGKARGTLQDAVSVRASAHPSAPPVSLRREPSTSISTGPGAVPSSISSATPIAGPSAGPVARPVGIRLGRRRQQGGVGALDQDRRPMIVSAKKMSAC